MTRVLLAGEGGQLGWEIRRRWPADCPPLAAFDRAGLDITDAETVAAVVERLRPGVVINAAAYTAVDRAESEREAAFAVNRDGAANLARAAAAAGAAILHVSTDYVFDGTGTRAWTEDDPTCPVSVYGESKLAGEHAVAAANPRHVILRTAWVHGVHGGNFVRTMLRLGAERDEIAVVDDQRGSPTETKGLAEAAIRIALGTLEGREDWGIFHCAGAGETTWCGFAREIFALAEPLTGRRPLVRAIATADYPTPARRPANSVLDCTRLARTWGIALPDWRVALAEMIAELHGAEQATGGGAVKEGATRR